MIRNNKEIQKDLLEGFDSYIKGRNKIDELYKDRIEDLEEKIDGLEKLLESYKKLTS